MTVNAVEDLGVRPAPGYPPRTVIPIIGGDRPRMAAEAIGVLADTRRVFRRGPILSQIVEATDKHEEKRRAPIRRGTPIIRQLPIYSLLCELERRIEWRKWNAKKEEWATADCPEAMARMIDAEGPMDERLPDLVGILQAPALRADGSIITEHGYDDATGYYLASRLPLSVPAEPTIADARVAWLELERLFLPDDSPTCRGFPWAGGRADAIVPVAALLTLLARPAIEGPSCTPAFFIDAPVAGSGKGTIIQICSLIAQGRQVAAQNWPVAIEEQEKTLASYAIAAPSIVFLDNLRGTIASTKLEATLTNEHTGFRVLGRMDLLDIPWRSLVMIAGNNAKVGGDMHRRMIVGRLQPSDEHPERIPPEHRRYPNIEAHAVEHRARYISAGLTLLRAYALEKGDKPAPFVASFGAWSGLVGGALAWVGAGDITRYVGTYSAEEDEDTIALRALVKEWARLDSTAQGMTCAGARALLYPESVLTAQRTGQGMAPDGWETMREAIEGLTGQKPGYQPNTKILGDKIGGVKGRNLGGYSFEAISRPHGSQRWLARVL